MIEVTPPQVVEGRHDVEEVDTASQKTDVQFKTTSTFEAPLTEKIPSEPKKCRHFTVTVHLEPGTVVLLGHPKTCQTRYRIYRLDGRYPVFYTVPEYRRLPFKIRDMANEYTGYEFPSAPVEV